jgi:RNA polymerase sigma factor (sigma-70 family)
VEASALTHGTHSAAGQHGRSPLLRLQSDERLIALVRRGSHGAFEVLVGRYQSRLLAFCRHMLGSREDAEDVLQEVFAAAFNAILADDRPINARPWLYRIARNRSLNHLRRVQPIGVDSMDVHFFEHGRTTADQAARREQFRELVADVQELPETQRTALLLREIDALSYEQIAEAMETTIPSVKSLLVRARVSLAEAAEARQLSCEDVRLELGEVAEGLRRRPSPPVRRHLRGCDRCTVFRAELRATSKALALLLPVGPLLLAKRALLAHLGLSSVAGAGGAGSTASGTAAAGAFGGAASAGGGGLVSAGLGALTTKAAAGVAAAALVTAGAVEIERHAPPRTQPQVVAQQPYPPAVAALPAPAPTHAQRASDAPAERPERGEPVEKEAIEPVATTPATPPAPVEGALVPEPGHTHVETGATTLPVPLPTDAPPPTLVPAPTATTTAPAAAAISPPAATTATPPATTTPAPPPATPTPTLPGDTTPVPPPPVPPADGTETPPATVPPVEGAATQPSPPSDASPLGASPQG